MSTYWDVDYFELVLSEMPDGTELTVRRDPGGTFSAKLEVGWTTYRCSASSVVDAIEAVRTLFRCAR